MNRWLVAAAMAAAMCLGTNDGVAQQDGNRPRFDPAQMMQRRTEMIKEQMEVTDDAEWKAIQPLVQKVMEAQMATLRSGMGRGMMGGPPRRQGGDNEQGNRPRGGMFGQPSPEAEALQKAVDAKAPKAELKAALDKYVAARKTKQADLEKAQDDLRKVLTARQ